MKKTLLVAALVIIAGGPLFAQKYMTRTGKIIFDATTPSSPEKIVGINNEVGNILDIKTGDIVFQLPVKSFKFERELMQEHFNENYMESDKFPKAEFRGTVTNLSDIKFAQDGTYPVKVNGKLTIHGVTNEVVVPGTLTVKGNTIDLKTKFSIKLKDYKVDVPAVVADKVSKEAGINLESLLSLK